MERQMIKNKGNCSFLTILLLLLYLPTSAYADAGTALMWVTVFHLLIGNALIGILEGIVIAKIFGVRLKRSILIMIPANYFSSIAGAFGVCHFNTLISSFASIYNISYILFVLWAGSYFLTIVLEWPFCYWILKGQENRKQRSFKASVIAQTVSYALLIPIYLSCSGVSLVTKTTVDKSLSFLKTKNAWVYFLSPKGDTLYKIRINGADKQRVKESGIDNEYTHLFICNDNGKANLRIKWYKILPNHRSEEQSKVLLEDTPGVTTDKQNCGDKNAINFFDALDLRSKNDRDWSVAAGGWAIEGLRGTNKKTKKSFWVALEAPFLAWSTSNATVLPGQQVVCQIGNQIILFDINTSKIGLITFGRSPVVALEK